MFTPTCSLEWSVEIHVLGLKMYLLCLSAVLCLIPASSDTFHCLSSHLRQSHPYFPQHYRRRHTIPNDLDGAPRSKPFKNILLRFLLCRSNAKPDTGTDSNTERVYTLF